MSFTRRLIGAPSQADYGTSRSQIGRGAIERLLEPLEPSWRKTKDPRETAFSLVSVYRKRNIDNLLPLLESAADVRLWALDETAEEVSAKTAGTGPGTRFSLLNRLLSELGTAGWVPPGAWLVVADDDVVFRRGDVAHMVDVSERAGLHLSAPSHHRRSNLNWSVTRHHLGSIARLCRYVEQGPLLAFSPEAQAALLPFPEHLGMGWGIEAAWAAHSELRLGIVDDVTVDHRSPVLRSGGYDVDSEWAQAVRCLEDSGFRDWSEVQRINGYWRPWQRRPPWSGLAPGGQPGS